MKIIVVGLGQAGQSLVSAISGPGYDVVVIDTDKNLIDEITDKYNVNGFVGSGASKETLLKAGADTADTLIALTHTDEINLLSCMQAKKLGTKKCAARLMLPDLADEAESIKNEYNIDFLVRPKSDIADEIYRNIGLPGFVKMESAFDSDIRMMLLQLIPGSPLIGKTLANIRKDPALDMLVCSVIRNGKLYIPDGTFILEEKDSIGIIAQSAAVPGILKTLGISRNAAKKIVIVGGGITTEYLLKKMKDDKKDILILESNINRCRELMEKYPHLKVSYAEEDVTQVLEEEHIDTVDAIISLTDHDETNLVISMYAWSVDVHSIITRVDKPVHVKLLHKVNTDITVSLTETAVKRMLGFIRNHEIKDADNEVTRFSVLAEGKAEIMEFVVGDNFAMPDVAFASKEFKLKKDILIFGIIREGRLIIPSGTSSIQKGDRVIVIASKKHRVRNLNDIFA